MTSLFDDIDNVDHVFALKLALFETKTISDSKNDEAKKEVKKI